MRFCILWRNSRWPSTVAGKQFLLKVASRLFIYPEGQKFHRNRSILHCFKDKCFLRFMQKLKMATKSGRKVIFVKSRQYTLYTLGVENCYKIPLSRTVKEIEANLCFSIFGKNSKWPSFLERGKILKIGKRRLVRYPVGWKIRTKLFYLAWLRR